MTTRALALGIAVVIAAGACADDQPSPRSDVGASSSTVDHGLAVSLTVDRIAVAPGGSVEAIVVVHNLSSRKVRWRAGGCDLVGSVSVVSAARAVEAEADAEEDVQARLVARFVDVLAQEADRPAPARPPRVAAGGGRACQIDHGFAELGPGSRLTERVTWSALSAGGAAISPGRYVMSGAFPLVAADVPLAPAEFTSVRDVRPVAAEIEIDVEDDGPSHLTAREALVALISDTPLGDWVRAGTVDAGDAGVSFDGRAWVVRIGLPAGGVAVGRVGVRDGAAVLESEP
ncbi:MAG: hypothetical protein WEC14_06565 [Chloroflexota bacterium]